MTLKLVRDEMNAQGCTAERDAAWEVFVALAHHQRANPRLEHDAYFQRAVQSAHDRFARLFGGAV